MRSFAAGMHVLYLTSEFLWPPLHGGRVRSLSQLRLLLAQPELSMLHVFSLSEVPVSAADLDALRSALGNPAQLGIGTPVFHPIHLRQHKRKLIEVGLRRLFSGTPYLLAKWRSPSVEAALSAQLTSRPWDIVYIDHLGMAVYLPLVRRLCPRARVVVESHNIESEFFAQFAASKPQPLRLFAGLEADAAADHEARVLAEADAVVAISFRDAQGLRKLALRKTGRAVQPLVVPPVVEISPVEMPAHLPPRLVYVGNLTWHPNVAGLDWLCQSVFPKVRELLPAATLQIAGSGLSHDDTGKLEVPAQWQAPGIEVVGFVPSLSQFVAGSPVMVAPVFGGSGVRIKLLDSLRLGIPTVTTRDGASGLPLSDDIELRICDDPAEFARAVVALCQDSSLRARLRKAGLAFLSEHHSPKHAQTALRMAMGLPVLG